jgi:hypothetical protein
MWDHARGTPWPGKRGDSVAASEMNKIALAIAVFAALVFATPAHADRPDLTPFVGSWAGKRESVNIDANGYGWFNYMDVQACQRCAMSDMPYANMDFAITSVSGNTARGSVTADKYHHAGEPVVISLTPPNGSAPPTISWTVSGLDEGLFCPAANSSWCGF